MEIKEESEDMGYEEAHRTKTEEAKVFKDKETGWCPIFIPH